MLIDPQRNPETTYRLTAIDGKLYYVTVYPKTPAPIHKATYRLDLLPEWLQDCVRLLDTAGNGHVVDSVGRKVGPNYWIEAVSDPDDTSWTRLIEAQKMLDMESLTG